MLYLSYLEEWEKVSEAPKEKNKSQIHTKQFPIQCVVRSICFLLFGSPRATFHRCSSLLSHLSFDILKDSLEGIHIRFLRGPWYAEPFFFVRFGDLGEGYKLFFDRALRCWRGERWMGMFRGRMNVQYVSEPGCIVSALWVLVLRGWLMCNVGPLHCLETEIAKICKIFCAAKLFLLLFFQWNLA